MQLVSRMKLPTVNFRELVSGQSRGIGPSVLRTALSGLEAPYWAMISARNWAYDWGWLKVSTADRPVISVGNLTLGGSGKTPLIEYLAKWFRAKGVRVSIVSRGYGAAGGGPNDEAMELEEKIPDVPHVQNADRLAAAKIAVEELDMELLLLDDAMQHRRIHRDLEIVVIDATEPFGYGRLFPRGALREPIGSLARADVIVLSRSDMVTEEERARIRKIALAKGVGATWVEACHAPQVLRNHASMEFPLESLLERSVFAFCGIGNPEAFYATLRQLGCKLAGTIEFPDHHAYSKGDLTKLADAASASQAELLVTTHKDLVKIGAPQLGSTRLLALQVGLRIAQGAEALDTHLNRIWAMVRDLSSAQEAAMATHEAGPAAQESGPIADEAVTAAQESEPATSSEASFRQ